MDFLSHLISGLGIALLPSNLLYALIGVIVGTAIGVLPGLGPPATIALLLPITFKINPVSAVIMLAGIYYGAMYGGSTTSILLNIPGEAASVVTCHRWVSDGPAGHGPEPALGVSALGSFFAGTVSIIRHDALGFVPWPPLPLSSVTRNIPHWLILGTDHVHLSV